MKLSIARGNIVDPKTGLIGVGDIYIENGVIVCIDMGDSVLGEKPSLEGYRVIDAHGLTVTPGLVDLHVHFREPGQTYKEDVETGGLAAAAGGFTTVCMMPNTNPVTDSGETAAALKKRVEESCCINALAVGAITKGQRGDELADMADMLKSGICAVSEDGRSVANAAMMLSGMRLAKELSLPVFSHTEDDSLKGTPIGEELIVARDILLAGECGAKLHLCHISARGSLEMIRGAKARGISLTAETAPHYFTLDETMRGSDGNRKMNPPLRTGKDVEAVRRAIVDGTLDVIATDHAPHSREEKDCLYENAMNGVVGLETSFPVSYTALVRGGLISIEKLVELMSARPSEILGIPCGIEVGGAANIAVFDTLTEYIIDKNEFLSKGRNTPFDGMKVYGRPVMTVCEGRIVFDRLKGETP